MASYVCISDLILFVLNNVMGIMGIDNNNKIKNRAGRVVYDCSYIKHNTGLK